MVDATGPGVFQRQGIAILEISRSSVRKKEVDLKENI